MSAPDQDLVDALELAGCTVRDTSVVCAFHGDRTASGSLYVGNDGRWRYKCHACDVAGDAADIIARHTGRSVADVLRDQCGEPLHRHTKDAQRTFATLEALSVAIHRKAPESMYCYALADGRDHLAVLRLPGKQFRQAHWDGHAWHSGGVATPWPLYRLQSLAADPPSPVVLTEGEKDADALAALGINATTAPMGADAISCPPEKDGKPGKVDWSPLAGRTVVLFGDDDEPGKRHMARVVRCLERLTPRPTILAVRGQDRHDMKDAADLIAQHGEQAALDAIAKAVPVVVQVKAPRFELRTFADTPTGTVSWIMPGVIARGMVTLLGGKQGLGKSYVLCDFAARITTGQPLPDGTIAPCGNVLMLAREDDAGTILKPRLEAAGADLSRITWTTLSDRDSLAPLDFAAQVSDVAQAIISHQFALVIVDTFAAFASAGTDANASQDVRALLDPIARTAQQTGAAVIVSAHVRKSGRGEGDAMDAIAGSAQMTAGVRIAALLEPGQTEGERWLRVVKCNVAPINSTGWTFRFEPPANTGNGNSADKPPALRWSVAGDAYRHADADRRLGRVTIAPEALLNAVLAAVAKRPLTIKDAAHRAWDDLRETMPTIRKADVVSSVEDLAADPSSCLEVGTGPKGARLIGLPGAIPEIPEDKARRLAVPGMTIDKLTKLAGCRRTLAAEILRDLKA